MRLHNSDHVLRIVKRLGPLSRTEIAKQSKLSLPTVGAVINDLLLAGMVEEFGAGESTGGRKPLLVSFNPQCGAVIGGNIGATSARLVLADMRGEWLVKRLVQFDGETHPKPLLQRVIEAAKKMCKEELGSKTPLLAVVIGAPGMTDIKRGVVIEAANLDGWVNVPVGDILEKKLGVPVIVDNDVNLAAVGEHWQGGGRGLHNFVFIMMGTGIGSGIVIDNKIYRGHRWHAGEISHLNLDFREWETNFGAAGYLEAHLSPKQQKQSRKLQHPQDTLNDEALIRLGVAVANIATIVDPEAIIFGGRIAISQQEMLSRVSEVAKKIAPNCPKICLTELGEDAPLYGSIKIALNHAEESLHEVLLRKVWAAA